MGRSQHRAAVMDVTFKVCLPWIVMLALAIVPAQASLVETTVTSVAGTPVECIQNDGPRDDGAECDAADICQDAYQSIKTGPGERTPGMLVPVDDETDFFLADFASFAGQRMRLHVAGFSMEYSVTLYDDACGLLAEGAGAAATAGTSADIKTVFSGIKPYQPITTDYVTLDGTPAATFNGVGAFSQVIFRVTNTPKHVTFDEVVYAVGVGQSVLLCGFAGDLDVNVGAGGGNIKFDGAASALQLRDPGVAFDPCPPPPEPDANPECGTHYCDVTVNSLTSHVRLKVHYDGPQTEPDPIVIPASCHDGCLGGADALPVPGEFDIGVTGLTVT